MNTKKINTYGLINRLSNKNIKLNITAIFTNEQIINVIKNLNKDVPAYISVFAGRIADSGINPINIIKYAVTEAKKSDKFEVIWASPRQVYNVIECEELGCHIITATKDIIKKINLFGKDLEEFSLETVKMFYNDAQEAKYKL
jgi:transaldolase